MKVFTLTSLPDIFNCRRHEVAAGGFIAVLAFVLVVVELLRPWSSDLVDAQMISSVDDASWFPLNLLATAWSPYTAGIVIGLLQFHALFFIDTLLGTSSSYVTTLGYIFRAFSQNNTPEYVRKFMDTGKHLWQVALVVGIVIGAFFSSMLSGTTYPDPGVGRIAAFFGGVALVFGARVANGCTSGHGLSGMAQLAVSSFITVAAMFAGGMIYAFIFLRG
eukprot:GEZU01020863.1.p1 GENE.GEZU01020863.1~~GEZU01020863.1.p1  ORF type:complete len:219 (-),score=16.98 GEZU01020863.1:717-1373(-)